MANPSQPTLSEAEADALQGTADVVHGTRISYIGHGVGPDDSPKLRTLLTQQTDQILRQLGGANQGHVIDRGGLNVGVHALTYEIAGVKKTYAGQDTVAMTDNATNYVYLDGSSSTAVQVSTSAFPADVFMLAEVVCAAADISSIVDSRMRNFETGLTNAWASVPASQDVDMNAKGLDDLAHMEFTDSTELTIASGAITPTQTWHTVDTEGDAAADNLDTITATAGQEGRLLLLEAESIARVVTIRDSSLSGGNIVLAGPSQATYDFDEYPSYMLLMQNTATGWIEVARASKRFDSLLGDLAVLQNSITSIGKTGYSASMRTISAGSFVYEWTFAKVETQSGASTDDLDTVTGATDGELLIMRPYNDTHTVVVKHAIGADKFKLAHGTDYTMDTDQHMLICWHDGTQWIEIARSVWEPAMFSAIATDSEGDAIPFNPGGHIHIAGALSAGAHSVELLADHAFTLKGAGGALGTAPSGGPCIVDVQVDTGGGYNSIFANDAERINFAAGVTTDISTAKWLTINAGNLIRISVLTTSGSPNSAQDLTVVLNGRSPCVSGGT